jgi:DNA invertase Pin-like site-specific DNA recombinase
MNERIKPEHVSRKAILYIRQSSPSQVQRNEESKRLQYAMRQQLLDSGWTEVETIDEDLGKSAAGATERSGFERMVAEVCMGKVGAVAARELSRFARNSNEWQHLVEVCRVVNTLLIDHETVYDSRRGNDRLLLGLKGSLNEYELDILRLRSVEARRAKARRGELIFTPPIGYIKTVDGRVEKDPDQRVQETIRLVFRKMLELGAARQTCLWLQEHNIELPVRRCGPTGFETVWRRARYPYVYTMLENPLYGGYYAYGKTEMFLEYRDGKASKHFRRKPKERWLALIPGKYESYVDRGSYDRVQEMLLKNAQNLLASVPGAAKRGPALLTGVLRCRRCGSKLSVRYSGNPQGGRYLCCRGDLDKAEPSCIGFGAADADAAIARELLAVVQPAAIDASRLAAQRMSEQDDALKALKLELQAQQYSAEKLRRQYDAADPENRLVTAELERRWNAALEKVHELENRIEEEAAHQTSLQPTPIDLGPLADDLQRVWDAPGTDSRLKKRIARVLIEEIMVDTDPAAGDVELVIHWKGGVHTVLHVRRRRRNQMWSTKNPKLAVAVRQMATICTDMQIAGYLNRNGLRNESGNRWTPQQVACLRKTGNIPPYSETRCHTEGWMNLTKAARHVGLGLPLLRKATESGAVSSLHPLHDGPWIFRRQDLDQPGMLPRLHRFKLRGRAKIEMAEKLSLFESST